MHTYLSQSALQLSKEIVIGELLRFVVYVIYCKEQLLNILKVIVNLKSVNKVWIKTILHIFRASNLKTYTAIINNTWHTPILIIIKFSLPFSTCKYISC